MSLRKNVVANFVGQGWRAIMSLVFLPLYIDYLGMEAFGLIGIFVMLQAWLRLVDLGMRPAVLREMARFTGGEHDAESIRDLLRSIEIVAAGAAVAAALAIWGISGWLAQEWVRPDELATAEVAQAFVLMGVLVGLRILEGIYTSSMDGLQEQVLQNTVTSIMATFRGLGAVAVLILIAPTIQAFFVWQIVVSVVTLVVTGFAVYYKLPRAGRAAHFSVDALRAIRKFAAGMIGITVMSLLLTQMDKIVLSRLLSLENFGYYALAATVAAALQITTGPIVAAFFPRFTELYTRRDDNTLAEAYHLGAQLVAVLTGSAALVLIFFADRVLLLWTGDPELTARVAPILVVLALGTLLNSLMWVPYHMQLAHGWTSLTMRINTIAVVLLVPAMFWTVPKYGAVGAAWIWVALNAGYLLFGVHFMYRRILSEEKWRWYFVDTASPVLMAGVAAWLFSRLLPDQLSRVIEILFLAIISSAVVCLASAAAPLVRTQAIRLAFSRT